LFIYNTLLLYGIFIYHLAVPYQMPHRKP